MKTVAIDFDGTLAKYDRWRGKRVFGHPIEGARDALCSLKEDGWTIIINTTRLEIDLIREYLVSHGMPFDHINYNPANVIRDLAPTKVLADVYVDDRNVEFDGDWKKALKRVEKFKVWYKE